MHTPNLVGERGIALAISVFAMVVIGGLVGATFYVGHLEQRSGRNTMYATQSFEASEAGLTSVLTAWNNSYNSMAVGDTMTLPTVNLSGMVSFTPALTRLNSNLFLVKSTGRRTDAGGNIMAKRTVGALSRLLIPSIDMGAALTVDGALHLGGTAEIHGIDAVPTGWGGCPATQDVPGIRSSGTTVTTSGSGCSGLACVDGIPPFVGGDTTVTAQTFTDFGGITFAELAALADHNLSGTVTGAGPSLTGLACNTGDADNWGEPFTGTAFGACSDHFPILYAPGDVSLSGGRGQGILLVEGDLNLSGGVEFFGVVIVQGSVKSTGTGGHITGGVMAAQADFDPTTLTGNSVAQFSSCSIARALQLSANAQPLAGRSWAQLYN